MGDSIMVPKAARRIQPLIGVRPAVVDDVPWLLTELRAFTVFYGKTWLLPASDELASQVIASFVGRADIVFNVAERFHPEGSTPVGLVAAHVGPYLFNPTVNVLTELAWWVSPSARGALVAHVLFEDLLGVARERGVRKIIWSLLPQSPVDPATLQKRGFQLHERSFLLEV